MRIKAISTLAAFVAVLLLVSNAFGQSAHETPFVTSITIQNMSDTTATVDFEIYREGESTPIVITQSLAAWAGGSLFLGTLDSLPSSRTYSVKIKSTQPLAAVVVQLPQSTSVKNRPLTIALPGAPKSCWRPS